MRCYLAKSNGEKHAERVRVNFRGAAVIDVISRIFGKEPGRSRIYKNREATNGEATFDREIRQENVRMCSADPD